MSTPRAKVACHTPDFCPNSKTLDVSSNAKVPSFIVKEKGNDEVGTMNDEVESEIQKTGNRITENGKQESESRSRN